jgi:VacB/RNase II family 3'-5' exoribonuclease
MPESNGSQHRAILQRIARRVMIERGLSPDFPADVLSELAGITGPAATAGAPVRDLTGLLWCSIDNDDSLDLDQLTVAEAMPGGTVKIYVAIADVDATAAKQSAIDLHAGLNTLSIYTPAVIFPMLPEKLSTDLTSLKFNSSRLSMVVEMLVGTDGSVRDSDVYRAMVRNRAKLAYNSTAAWLDGAGPKPREIAAVPGLDKNIKLQDSAAAKMKALRYEHGALNFDTIETKPVFAGDELKGLVPDKKNRAKDIIEDFMIAANGVTARFLEAKKSASIRRVVQTPKKWDRIVELAAEKNFKLPAGPDSKSLDGFLDKMKTADPASFPDISLSVIKLLGPGEYIVELPGSPVAGHFGLAVKDYTHSTAPNRRYPDLITQRLLKAAAGSRPSPYSNEDLYSLAAHCTEKEDAAKKAERQVEKSAAALLLDSRTGEEFDAVITGASDKGTWVRIFDPPVEGRLSGGAKGLDVGHKLRVKLIHTDVEKGYIDFKVSDT